MSMTAEICPHCGRPTNPDVCSFCGATMDPDDRYCPECGNSREGIVCPECGTLNFRSFCRKCNHPLDRMAQAAVAQAQADPKYQRMVALQKRMVELERQILDGADHALSEADEQLKKEYDALLAMIQGGVSENKAETQVSDESLKQIAKEYRESVQEMNEIMADLMPDAGMTPQEQRNYFCARKLPVITVTKQEGVIPGGGVALAQAAKKMESKDLSALTDEEQIGYKIVRRALEEPMRQIAENAGEDGAIIADKCKNSDKGVGYDANNDKWVNMVEAGIIDPVKVTRSALQNAASIAALILTSECAITDIPAPEPPAPAGNPGMGMM